MLHLLDSGNYFVLQGYLFEISGICYQDNCGDESMSVPYGTNLNGQLICYTTEKTNFGQSQTQSGFDSCAPQLTQVNIKAGKILFTRVFVAR